VADSQGEKRDAALGRVGEPLRHRNSRRARSRTLRRGRRSCCPPAKSTRRGQLHLPTSVSAPAPPTRQLVIASEAAALWSGLILCGMVKVVELAF
jgi:hypothetical protein